MPLVEVVTKNQENRSISCANERKLNYRLVESIWKRKTQRNKDLHTSIVRRTMYKKGNININY
jgi:hypothetical protein